MEFNKTKSQINPCTKNPDFCKDINLRIGSTNALIVDGSESELVSSFDVKVGTAAGSGKDAFGNGISYPTVSPVSIETVEDRLNEEKRTIIIPTEEVVEKMRKEIKEYVNG